MFFFFHLSVAHIRRRACVHPPVHEHAGCKCSKAVGPEARPHPPAGTGTGAGQATVACGPRDGRQRYGGSCTRGAEDLRVWPPGPATKFCRAHPTRRDFHIVVRARATKFCRAHPARRDFHIVVRTRARGGGMPQPPGPSPCTPRCAQGVPVAPVHVITARAQGAAWAPPTTPWPRWSTSPLRFSCPVASRTARSSCAGTCRGWLLSAGAPPGREACTRGPASARPPRPRVSHTDTAQRRPMARRRGGAKSAGFAGLTRPSHAWPAQPRQARPALSYMAANCRTTGLSCVPQTLQALRRWEIVPSWRPPRTPPRQAWVLCQPHVARASDRRGGRGASFGRLCVAPRMQRRCANPTDGGLCCVCACRALARQATVDRVCASGASSGAPARATRGGMPRVGGISRRAVSRRVASLWDMHRTGVAATRLLRDCRAACT